MSGDVRMEIPRPVPDLMLKPGTLTRDFGTRSGLPVAWSSLPKRRRSAYGMRPGYATRILRRRAWFYFCCCLLGLLMSGGGGSCLVPSSPALDVRNLPRPGLVLSCLEALRLTCSVRE